LLGREKTAGLLGQLASQLKGGFAKSLMKAEERQPLAREAHKIISSAGLLGFVGLSRSCAKLEAVLGGETDATECLEEVREACRAALAEIAERMERGEKMLESA
jgi:HPt (histidine-containing phosphotransfer) domain-containing protein